MWIGRKAFAFHFLSEAFKLSLGQTALEKSACIYARCRVPLKEDKIRSLFSLRAALEMVEAYIV